MGKALAHMDKYFDDEIVADCAWILVCYGTPLIPDLVCLDLAG